MALLQFGPSANETSKLPGTKLSASSDESPDVQEKLTASMSAKMNLLYIATGSSFFMLYLASL
jgi:hypothetical protein